MSSLLMKIFSSKKDSDKRKEEARKFRRESAEKRAAKARESGLGSMGAILGAGIGAVVGDNVGYDTTHKTISDLKDRQWRSNLDATNNSFKYEVRKNAAYADSKVRNRALDALNKEISSANKFTKATEDAVKATEKYRRGSVLRGGLVGAGLGLAAGVGGAALINHNIKKKRKQKTFSDRDSAWWRKRIEELEKKDPNSPRLQKFREQLDYALAEEAKAKGASEEARAAGRAAEERMRNNSSAGQRRSSYSGSGRQRTGGSNSSWEEEFTKSWNERVREFREQAKARDNSRLDEIFNKATENAKKNEASFAEAEKWTNRVNKKNKKANKVAVGVGLASLGTVAGIKAYQHYKNKKAA